MIWKVTTRRRADKAVGREHVSGRCLTMKILGSFRTASSPSCCVWHHFHVMGKKRKALHIHRTLRSVDSVIREKGLTSKFSWSCHKKENSSRGQGQLEVQQWLECGGGWCYIIDLVKNLMFWVRGLNLLCALLPPLAFLCEQCAQLWPLAGCRVLWLSVTRWVLEGELRILAWLVG